MSPCRGGNLFLKPVVLRRHSAGEDDELLDVMLCRFACGIAAGQFTGQKLVLYRATGDLGPEFRNLRSRLHRPDPCLSEFAIQPVSLGKCGIALTHEPVKLRGEFFFLGLDRITFARQRLDFFMSFTQIFFAYLDFFKSFVDELCSYP